MKNLFPCSIPLAVVLCASLFFACTSDLEMPPPTLPIDESSSSLSSSSDEYSSSSTDVPSSSSAEELMKYCVYSETRLCFLTSQTKCPAGGELSDFCPFPTPSSSSDQIEQSSSSAPYSSSQVEQSSSDAPYSSSSIAPISSSSNPPPDSFKMISIIYDTDNSVNSSFCANYSSCAPNTANNGIRRGIVAPTLDTATRKPTFASAKANWTGEASFNAAFNPKALLNGNVSNIPRCYDMPFSKIGTTNGNWEFDSDKMRTPDDNNIVGGFFPYVLDTSYIRDTVDYSDCPTCKNKYTAACFSRLTPANVPSVTYKGINYTGLDAFDRTYFPDGNTHHNYYSGSGCTTLRPGYPGTLAENRANLSFCFESHGEFIYEKGQEFFFRGDDDIWVFINDKLVIDLGGTHMPAPGYVDLDSIGRNWDAQGRPVEGRSATKDTLVEGESYPIDIFFCERLATQSNVRVSTSIYITQTTANMRCF